MNDSKIKDMTFTALMTALLCIIAPFSIPLPFSPVPISASLFIIYLCTIVIGTKRALMAVILYLILGAAGLPVFTGFSGGLGKLLGPTGGYAIGYIFVALFTGFFSEKFKGKIFMDALGMILGTAFCYALGTAWLSFSTHTEPLSAFLAGVLPYIPGDVVKITIVCIIGERTRKLIFKNLEAPPQTPPSF